MNLLNIVDIPGWMLVRGAGLDLERRERLITALLDGHLSMIEVKRTLVRLYPDMHLHEHRDFDGHIRGTTT